eukprot:13060690-Ditylum_brightwellii.AAC.1
MGRQTALFAGTAIAYSTAWQFTVATSSTKAEFVQALLAMKMAKYLQTVLNKLGIQQYGPTMIYEDNAAAIMMNELLTTMSSWHTSVGLLTQLMPSPRHWDGRCTIAMARASWDTWEQSIPTL